MKEPITVKVSQDLAARLLEGWSVPVHLKLIQKPSGEYEMLAKPADPWSLEDMMIRRMDK